MDIVKENKKRTNKLFCNYDPILGVNTVQKKIALHLSNDTSINIPKSMLKEDIVSDILRNGTLENYCIQANESRQYIEGRII